jgi:predicted DNA-binding transcriptional regulator AlpA
MGATTATPETSRAHGGKARPTQESATMEQPFVTAPIVATLIGLTDAGAFLRRRPRLEREQDFPAPMPTSLRPLIWRRSEIAAWVQAQGRPANAARPNFHTPALPSGNVVLMAQARRA